MATRVMHKRKGTTTLLWGPWTWYKTVCGIDPSGIPRTALHWAKVTCKNCLRLRPKKGKR